MSEPSVRWISIASFGPRNNKRAVNVRTEFDAVRLDFPDFGEAENLEAAAVGEDRPFPIHEFVQAAGGADDVESGPEVEMVSVAEDDLRAHLQQFARVEGLDAGLRADGHEHRRFDDAVRGGQFPEARLGLRIGFEEFKHRPAISGNETSTSRSAAIFSKSRFSAARSQCSGNCKRALALNNVSPDIGALTTSLENSSTFTPARGQRAGDFADDARTVAGRRFPVWFAGPASAGAGFGVGLDDDVQSRNFLERSQQRRFVLRRNFNPQNAGEFAAEPAHAAFEPVAAVAGHGARDGFNQPGAVRADEGHHQRNLHAGLLNLFAVPLASESPPARPSVAMNRTIRRTEIVRNTRLYLHFFTFQFTYLC